MFTEIMIYLKILVSKSFHWIILNFNYRATATGRESTAKIWRDETCRSCHSQL